METERERQREREREKEFELNGPPTVKLFMLSGQRIFRCVYDVHEYLLSFRYMF